MSQALVVLLENNASAGGVKPPWPFSTVLDVTTEEYAKLDLRLQGAYRRYAEVVILEDALATAEDFRDALLESSARHPIVDVLSLVHGQAAYLVGHQNQPIGLAFFDELEERRHEDPDALHLRAVWQINCYGAHLMPRWLALGARAVNGAMGVNWFPEPGLSVFLWHWLRGAPFGVAVQRGWRLTEKIGRLILPQQSDGRPHQALLDSRMEMLGDVRVTLSTPRALTADSRLHQPALASPAG